MAPLHLKESYYLMMRAERMTDSEVKEAISYLDPDLSPERTRKGLGDVTGIWITLLAVSEVSGTCAPTTGG